MTLSSVSLILTLREAVTSRRQVEVRIGESLLLGTLLELVETGSGRKSEVRSLTLRPEGYDLPTFTECAIATVSGKSNSGAFSFSGTARWARAPIPLIELSEFSELDTADNRDGQRTRIRFSTNSFVVIEYANLSTICALQITDISAKAIGGSLQSKIELPKSDLMFASGSLKAGPGILRLNRAEIVRIQEAGHEGESGLFSYKVALKIPALNLTADGVERRVAMRRVLEQFELVSIRAQLFQQAEIPARVIDISTGGLSVVAVEPADINLLPIGSTISIEGLVGFVVVSSEFIIRINWMLTSDVDRRAAHQFFSKVTGSNSEIRSYESNATMTLLVRSGVKSGPFLNSYSDAKDLQTDFGELSSAAEIVGHRAIKRDDAGKVIAHIGTFKVADNLWFFGDFFGSMTAESNSARSFVSEYMRTFVEFSAQSAPYPMVLVAWKWNHPYWQEMQRQSQVEGTNLVHATASARLAYPQISTNYLKRNDLNAAEVRAIDVSRIREIRALAKKAGVLGFLNAFDFSEEKFGSPLLRLTLKNCDFRFLRQYIFVACQDKYFLGVLSHLPEGLSPQRHQSAIWLIVLSEGVDEVLTQSVWEELTLRSVRMGNFPSLVRIIGKDLNLFGGEEIRIFVADPKLLESA